MHAALGAAYIHTFLLDKSLNFQMSKGISLPHAMPCSQVTAQSWVEGMAFPCRFLSSFCGHTLLSELRVAKLISQMHVCRNLYVLHGSLLVCGLSFTGIVGCKFFFIKLHFLCRSFLFCISTITGTHIRKSYTRSLFSSTLMYNNFMFLVFFESSFLF